MKLLALAALVFVSLVVTPVVMAEENTSVVGKSSGAGAAPPSAWKRKCEGAAGTPQENCYISQALASGGKVVFTAQFGYSGAKGERTAVFTTPLNVLLVPGLAVKIDDKEQVSFPFSICSQSGCRSVFTISDDMLDSLLSGNLIRIGWKGASGKDIVVPVRLSGFTAAWKTLSPKQ